jgi:hypothetical protein
VERGLFVAPGASFGPYPTHVRLCFTAAPPDVVDRGIEVLASLLRARPRPAAAAGAAATPAAPTTPAAPGTTAAALP